MLDKRIEKEAEDFDNIAAERYDNKQRPDISGMWENTYYYNNIWRHSQYFNQEYGPIIEWVTSHLYDNNITNISEFGCGTGWLTLDLARKGFDIVGYDISSKSLGIARQYVAGLPEYDELKLSFQELNISDFARYNGKSIVCFGFLHHLPKDILKERMEYIYRNMNKGEVLIAVEPRYDFVNFEMAFLVQALRMALPNHYPNEEDYENVYAHSFEVYKELGELDQNQSALDNESPSQYIVDTISEYYQDVEVEVCTAFYDKFIGSLRLSADDNEKLASMLKELDNMIIKYQPSFGRNLMLCAKKT